MLMLNFVNKPYMCVVRPMQENNWQLIFWHGELRWHSGGGEEHFSIGNPNSWLAWIEYLVILC